MDSHRNYPPEQPDGQQWYRSERDYPEPEWDRRGGDPRYAPGPGAAPYGDGPPYDDPGQRYADHDPYLMPEPRGGYPSDGEPRYAALTDQGGGPATGRMSSVGPRSGEPLPPFPAEPSFPPEAPLPQTAPSSGAPYAAPTSGAAHGALTSAMPQLSPDHPVPAGGPGAGRPGDPQGVRHSTEPIDRAALRRPSGGPGQLGDGVYRSRRPGTAAALIAVTVLFELIALRLFAASFVQKPVSVGGSIASLFLVLGLPMFGLGLYGVSGGVAATPGAGAQVWLRAPLVYLPVALALFLAAGLAAA